MTFGQLRTLRILALLSTDLVALGIPADSRLDRIVGGDRPVRGVCEALRPRAQASVPSLNVMRYLRESQSQPTDRRESAFLESACAQPG